MKTLFQVLFTLQISGDLTSFTKNSEDWRWKEEGCATKFGPKTDIVATTVASNRETEKQ